MVEKAWTDLEISQFIEAHPQPVWHMQGTLEEIAIALDDARGSFIEAPGYSTSTPVLLVLEAGSEFRMSHMVQILNSIEPVFPDCTIWFRHLNRPGLPGREFEVSIFSEK